MAAVMTINHIGDGEDKSTDEPEEQNSITGALSNKLIIGEDSKERSITDVSNKLDHLMELQ